jgi:hypothetical protein
MGVAATLASQCRQVEKLTKLILPAPTRFIVGILAMVPLLPPPPLLLLPPLIGGEDNARSTNANSSPATSAHAVFQALKAPALLDQPLLASCAGGKDSKGDSGNNNCVKLDHALDQDFPPLPPPLSGGRMATRIVGE